MSRAFVTDKEDWAYCPKAGERCMHAEAGRPCSRKSCEYYDSEARQIESAAVGLRVVSRRTEKAAAADESGEQQPAKRKTKKASIPKPQKWGGRSRS